MDVMKIRKSDFFSDGLIEGYTSMIWTERHTQLGDFQMKTPYVAETMAKIPEGSLIAINGSDEVCMVETHSIDKDDKGASELTTVGRSLENFLDNRILTGPYQEPWQIPGTYTVQDMILIYIWNSIVNPGAFEVIRDYSWDHLVRDVIPNVVVSDSTKVIYDAPTDEDYVGIPSDLQTPLEWWFSIGSLYTKVQEMLTLGNLGIRIIRPMSSNATILNSVSNGTHPTDPKTFSKSSTPETTNKLRFDVYNGRNRTVTSAIDTPRDVNPAVIFRYDTGDLQKPSYLFSIKDKKTLIHMQSSIQSVEVYNGETGLDLFEEWIDGGVVDDSLSPTDYEAAMINQARAEYKRKQREAFMTGTLSGTAPWVYGTDYYLGDLVTAVGDYGIEQTMQVSEYIRSYDKTTGDQSYPTLIEPPV